MTQLSHPILPLNSPFPAILQTKLHISLSLQKLDGQSIMVVGLGMEPRADAMDFIARIRLPNGAEFYPLNCRRFLKLDRFTDPEALMTIYGSLRAEAFKQANRGNFHEITQEDEHAQLYNGWARG